MIRFLILGSGSKGNATLIYDETTLFQIDMGIPLKRVKDGLRSLKKDLKDIQAVLITHEHSDHVSTLSLLPESIPVYASKGTLPHPTHFIEPEGAFMVGDFSIFPLAVSHDAANPIGYLILHDGEKLVYITDTGYLPDEDLPFLSDADYYIFESNHDYRMLMASQRPAVLKRRIHSPVGHLSNSLSAHYLSILAGQDTKAIYLAHISEECNTPELALATYAKVFGKKAKNLCRIRVECAKQWESVAGGDL